MLRIFIGSILLIVPALLAQDSPAGQPPSDFAGVTLKNRAPISDEVLRVTFPKPSESKLKNGMDLMVLEDHRSPTIQFQIQVPASSLNDPRELAGISGATTSMMRLGTDTLDAREIAEREAELGGSVSFSVGDRWATVFVSSLTENLDEMLDLMASMLFHPVFPEDEIAKWKNQQLTQLRQIRSNPSFLVTERFAAVMYPGDNRSFVSPSVEAINAITREEVEKHYRATFRPTGGRVAAVGDITAEQVAAKLNPLFEKWEDAAAPPPELPLRAPIKERKIYLIHRPDSVQTDFYLGNLSFERRSPDYIPAMVLNRVLGGGPASRLFRNIREEKGYTYGISSNFSASHYFHHFGLQTSVRTPVTAAALEEILRELRAIRDVEVPADELENAKRALVASFALQSERPETALSNAVTIKDYGFSADYWDTYPEKISKVTAKDVQAVARKYIPFDDVQIIVVGDATKIREDLAKFGPIEDYDSDGNKIAR